MDPHPLFAYTTLAASAASGATSITLTDATDFPDPASGAYNIAVWPVSTKPTKANAEVMRATAKAAAVLTVTRAQEGSTAYDFAAGDEVAVAITPKTLTDIETAISDHLADTADAHDASAISILDTANDFTATDVEGALAELQADNEAHVAAADPHSGYVLESLIDALGDLIVGSAADTVARLARGSTGQVLSVSADGSLYWKAESGGSISAVTALPGSPSDGDEVIFTDSLTAGTYHWHLRYVSGRSSNKWVFIGGPPMVSEVGTSEETTAATAYTALSTAGPSIAVPVAGSYIVSIGALARSLGAAINTKMSYDIGATGAVDADAASVDVGSPTHIFREKTKSLTAVTLTMKYKVTSNSGGWNYRVMKITPIALGG